MDKDYKTPYQGATTKHLSNKVQWELDCKEEEFRAPVFMGFSGKKGSGMTLERNYIPNDTWRPVPPDTVVAAVFEVACDTTKESK